MASTRNGSLFSILVMSALAWTGCVSSHPPAPPPDAGAADAYSAEVDAHVTPPVEMDASAPLACIAAGERGCASAERVCCEGMYCQLNGYLVQYDSCVVAASDGEACGSPSDCVSGNCESGLCRMAGCAAEGGECFAAYQCCAGFCPAEFTYGPSACTVPLPAGEWCYSDAWCASGACMEGSCL